MRVLIAEDDAGNRLVVSKLLAKWGYEAVVARDGGEARRILSEPDAPRVAILDWMMPEANGPQLCREIREGPQRAYTYVVLLTARSEQQDVIAGMNAGADDYLRKPFDADELRARLRAGTRIVELENQLRFQATHDPLTGVSNRRAILEILNAEAARAGRTHASLTVMMLDIDHFKQVNDTYGHPVGDQVLRETTRRITACVRAYDSVGRYGGEEFLIVLPGCDLNDARKRAETMRADVCAVAVEAGDARVPVTISIGLADWAVRRHAVETLLAEADLALYRAKAAGRNRVEAALQD